MIANETSVHRQGYGIGRFWEEVNFVPPIAGHPWDILINYEVSQLIAIEHQLKFDLTKIAADRQRHKDRGDLDGDWLRRSMAAMRIRQQQLVGVRTLRRMRQPESGNVPTPGTKKATKYDERKHRHLARVCRALMIAQTVEDIAACEKEIADVLAVIEVDCTISPEEMLKHIREDHGIDPTLAVTS